MSKKDFSLEDGSTQASTSRPMIPGVYAASFGSLSPSINLDTHQFQEILLTAGQSLFAVALLVDLRLQVREAVWLLVLFAAQLLSPMADWGKRTMRGRKPQGSHPPRSYAKHLAPTRAHATLAAQQLAISITRPKPVRLRRYFRARPAALYLPFLHHFGNLRHVLVATAREVHQQHGPQAVKERACIKPAQYAF